MKTGFFTHHLNTTNSDMCAGRRLAAPLENLGATQYTRRSWRCRLPAVLIASLLIVIILMVVGISLDGAPLLVLVPLVCLPLAAAVALGGA